MRFLFTTIQYAESDFYARVGQELERRGHQAAHVTISRQSARRLERRGVRAWCLPDLMAALPAFDVAAETRRIEERYEPLSLRDIYRTDYALKGVDEATRVERTVRHVLALERVFDELRPDVVVPEVGRETMREAAYLIGRERGATVLFMFNSPFPKPLRLYANRYHGPMVPPEEVRPLSSAERAEVEEFIAAFVARSQPILAHRRSRVTPRRLAEFARHTAVRAFVDRDNEYLRPTRFVTTYARQQTRRALLSRLYGSIPEGRRFVYFPLHVVDDFKIERVIPHCADQEFLTREVADSLPQGYDVVLKEHPRSIGRNSARMLKRLTEIQNVHLVSPYTSSHALIQRAAAVTVISSTVGIEALFYGKPVLTMGQPYYGGYGMTLDVDSFRELREAVPRVLGFRPDRERVLQVLHAGMRSTYDGAPAWIDTSQPNAEQLAASLEAAARREREAATPAPVAERE